MDNERQGIVRAAYAKQIAAISDTEHNERLQSAFSQVLRERFLGEPPWKIAQGGGYRELASSDRAVLYQDALFAIDADRFVNNGSPSLHAWCIHNLALNDNSKVAHIGAGTGYYTAILSHMVGQGGSVVALEYDQSLANFATDSLRDYSNVSLLHGSGSEWPKTEVNAIYVNYAVSKPSAYWLENLAVGGHLVFPIGFRSKTGRCVDRFTSRGALLRVTRSKTGFAVRVLSTAFFVFDTSAGEASLTDSEKALERAFRRGDIRNVRSLRWKAKKTAGEWLTAPDWGLAYSDS